MMDEPLGALDAEFRHHMCQELRGLHDRLGATTVYVTHDQQEAMSLADQVAVMNHGVVEQVGPPQEVYDRPASMFVASFLGSPAMNLLTAGTNGGRAVLGNAALAAGHAGGGAFVLGIRPEHVALDDAAPLRGEVAAAEYLGTTQLVTIDTEAGRVVARMSSAIAARTGEQVGLRFAPDQVRLFDPASGRRLDG